MSSGQQQIVALGGAGLIVGNFWLGPERKAIAAGLFTSGASVAQQQQAHDALKKIGAAVVFLLVATILSGVSAGLGRVMSATVLGLLLLWGINAARPGGILATTPAAKLAPRGRTNPRNPRQRTD